MSENTYFSHNKEDELDWVQDSEQRNKGTCVFITIKNNADRTTREIFDRFTFSQDDEYGFSKTIVPVRLAQYENEMLVSRSQAKRLLTRIDRFKIVLFDFEGIELIGRAFADEIFRVYKQNHREIELYHLNANKEVEQMIVNAIYNR